MQSPARLTLPRMSLLNPAFKYTPSNATNVAQTIERERQLQAQELARHRAALARTPQQLLPGIPTEPKVVRLRAALGRVITLPDL